MKITRSALKQLIKEQMTLLQEDESQTTLSGAEVPKYMFDGMERQEANAYMKSTDWTGADRQGAAPRGVWGTLEGKAHKVEIEGLTELSRLLSHLKFYPVYDVRGDEIVWRKGEARQMLRGAAYEGIGFEIGFRSTSDAIEAGKGRIRLAGEPMSDQHDATVYVTAKLNSKTQEFTDEDVRALQLILGTFNSQNGGRGGKMSVDGSDQSDFPVGLGWDWYYQT